MAFPSWPPPSGGYPNVTPEQGPGQKVPPYGSSQTPSISTQPPAPPAGYPIPWGSLKGTTYPQKMPSGANGQNQPQTLPPWPYSRLTSGSTRACVLPDKANPLVSQISPPPRLGPGPQSLQWEVGPIAGNPPPAKTFPAGSFLDGYGNLITPTGVVRTIGGLGN